MDEATTRLVMMVTAIASAGIALLSWVRAGMAAIRSEKSAANAAKAAEAALKESRHQGWLAQRDRLVEAMLQASRVPGHEKTVAYQKACQVAVAGLSSPQMQKNADELLQVFSARAPGNEKTCLQATRYHLAKIEEWYWPPDGWRDGLSYRNLIEELKHDPQPEWEKPPKGAVQER